MTLSGSFYGDTAGESVSASAYVDNASETFNGTLHEVFVSIEAFVAAQQPQTDAANTDTASEAAGSDSATGPGEETAQAALLG